MEKRPRVYLDTSVLSALGDIRWPDRQSLTREFFGRITEFDVATSEVTRIEIEGTRDLKRRAEMLLLLDRLRVIALTPEAHQLSDRYLAAKIFPASVPEDALHVAVAVLARQDVIISWNFKHLVNQRRRAAVRALNQSLGLSTPDIITPPEL